MNGTIILSKTEGDEYLILGLVKLNEIESVVLEPGQYPLNHMMLGDVKDVDGLFAENTRRQLIRGEV